MGARVAILFLYTFASILPNPDINEKVTQNAVEKKELEQTANKRKKEF